MRTALPQQLARKQSHRPRAVTVFAAAFVAGAAAAVGVNRALDVRLAQAKPRVESEAIFVALRSLPQGTPVTVWDVALRDWPKAMLPASALRAHDSFTGQVLRHPLREGQPLLAIQLMPASSETGGPADAQPTPPPAAYTQVSAPVKPPVEADLWAPVEPAAPPPAAPPATAESQPVTPAAAQPAPAASTPTAQETVAWPQPVVPPTDVPAPAASPLSTAPTPVVASSVDSQPGRPEAAAAQTAAGQTTPTDQPRADQIVGDQATQPAGTPSGSPAGPDTTSLSAASQPEAVAPAPVAAAVDVSPVAEPPAETAALPQTPTVVADIVAPEPVAEPVSVVATAPAAPAPPPVAEVAVRPLLRYLVVPENIAVQADRSFAIPTTPVPPAESQRAVSGPVGVQQLPPTTGSTVAAPRNRPSAQPAQQQRQAVGQEPRQPQQRQGRQPAPATGAGNGTATGPTSQPRLGAAMFPNISAGIEVIEGEWGRIRRDRTTADEQPASRQRPVTAR
ncbi:MAG: hypothetical protein RLZZ111_787 [Planctomycetota bacterium]|jgi:hypothetical protein